MAFDPEGLMKELETLCESCKGSGLDDQSIRVILSGARGILESQQQDAYPVRPCSTTSRH